MKTLKKMVGDLVAVLFIGSTFVSRAQMQLQPELTEAQAVEAEKDGVAKIVAEFQGLTAVSPNQLPRNATYWEAFSLFGKILPPMPCPPNNPDVVFYQIADGQFLVDNGQTTLIPKPFWRSGKQAMTPSAFIQTQVDEVVNLIARVQEAQIEKELKAQARQMGGMSLMVESEGSGGESFSLLVADSYGTNLWLEIPAVTDGAAYVVLHNVVEGEVYELMSKADLAEPAWLPELALHTVTNQEWIGATVPVLHRTNALFFWARDWTGITHSGNAAPDWWFFEYFGTVALSDTNLDGQGNTLLYDYQNGIDPNIISFSISVTNNYVNNLSAPLQLSIDGGFPASKAILVDSTNFNSANWTSYTSSNLTVNLGALEGWHDVRVGLRGRLTTSQQTWEKIRLKLDSTPPQLVITNPSLATGSQPMIQVQGYSSEPLRRLCYDLTNSTGLITNQPAFVTSQHTDTNSWEFTTNYFQAFDIGLAIGTNVIRLHVTDLAGNTTTTNINFVIDYSHATNPPTIQLTWPTNGTEICGDSFTWDGFIGDPTATVTAQIVATNGTTNTLRGLIERDGKFWVERLPLSSGTNLLMLTVVDAAGNLSATNISVVQSALSFTMNPVTPSSDLWKPRVNLSGTISDATYAVWANGVKGANNGDGTWLANNVPTTPGGTASFTIEAYSLDETQPDGSHGN